MSALKYPDWSVSGNRACILQRPGTFQSGSVPARFCGELWGMCNNRGVPKKRILFLYHSLSPKVNLKLSIKEWGGQ